jgi:serine/threonine protein kinase
MTGPIENARLPRKDTPGDLAGKQIGNYVVKGFLGAGSMGSVYLAEHPEIGRKVAAKVLAYRLTLHSEATQRFLAEARAAIRIDHPNVIEIFDFGRLPDGRPSGRPPGARRRSPAAARCRGSSGSG